MKSLKLITIELIILVIVLTSFIGIYKKDEYRVRNIVPDYKKGMSFGEQRLITMKVDDSVKETLIYDAEGKLVENKEEGIDYTEENGYKVVEVKTNDSSVLTKENYKKTKKIIAKRLKDLEVGEFKLNLNEETGEITVAIKEDDKSDLISYYLMQSGTFTLTDTETKELLLDETHLKDVKLLYGSQLNDEAKTESYVYLQLMFDKEGTKKIEELSKIYVEKTVEKEAENGTKEEVDGSKKLTVTLNDSSLGDTVIKNILYNNTIAITLGASTESEEFTKQSENAANVAKILKSGTLPIAYLESEETLEAYTNNKCTFEFYQLIYLIITIVLIAYLIIRYKTRGCLAGLLQTGFLATILIVLRYTNVAITETGILGLILALGINEVFLDYILRDRRSFNEILIKHFQIFIPVYIISIILSFLNSLTLASFGMTLTWGAIIIYIYNLLFTRNLIEYLKDGKSKK